MVSAGQPEIGVSARVFYTSDEDERLDAITDSTTVPYGNGNPGD